MDQNNVSLTISKEIVQPIVKAKIEEAVLAAMGGSQNLIDTVIDAVFKTKVDHEGKISSYSSDNKYNWLDVTVTKQIKETVMVCTKEILATRQAEIKAAILKQLSSKKGIEAFAQALIEGTGKLSERYYSNVTVEFKTKDY